MTVNIFVVGFLSLLLLPDTLVQAQQNEPAIQLNQLGFYPLAPKTAVLTRETVEKKFYLLSADTKDTLYEGVLSRPIQSNNSALTTRLAVFSEFTRAGKYVIAITGAGNSCPFSITENVNRAAAIAALKGFYFQRSSMPLGTKYAGQWSRPAGHPDTAVLIHASAASEKRPPGIVINSAGGWYDAGDYNKYIVNSGITMGTLLSAYEDFSTFLQKAETNIPESGNGVPDVLDEVVYNLRWMLTMQDPADGGVYNKCTNADFDGMVMPGVTRAPRYVVQKGTASTLDFAAVMAQSARVYNQYKNEFPGLADSCLKAAGAAWVWALKNPAIAYDQSVINTKYTPVITTGGYGDHEFADEFFWAACELYCTTKDEQYFSVIAKRKNAPMMLPSWNKVDMLGYYSLFRKAAALSPAANELVKRYKNEFIEFADRLASAPDSSAFATVMGKSKSDFNWGSNSNAANQGIALINAYFITKHKQYMHAALSNLDYILGRNATGYCFLTGTGSRSPVHIHHRQSEADGIELPVPGLLSGGPNPARQDKCVYQFTEPETSFTDDVCSYASNEIAINWNAPFVYLAVAMEALQQEMGYSK